MQCWLRELRHAESWDETASLFSPDALERFWEFNRFGHNFHPPMASYLNLVTCALFGWFWDDISSRRMASVFELAGAAALLCWFIGSRYGAAAGLFAGTALLTMPRLVGHAHVIGTDVPLLFFWATTALAFPRALGSRRWQWLLSLSAAGLFLVKFSGAVSAVPLGFWFVGALLVRQPRRVLWRWLLWSLVFTVPMLPLAAALLLGGRENPARGLLPALGRVCVEHGGLVGMLFFWPLVIYGCHWHRCRRAPIERWHAGLELPWVVLASAPLLCVALNPAWWHEPVAGLARYFALNLHRQENLPDIGIYYLGQRYLYSLPWHNAYVLMGVTIPWGSLLLGGAGCVLALARWRRDATPLYLLLHALALPAFRMLPTPAHDGVRLFLPTFFFWSGLAGIAAAWLAEGLVRERSRGDSNREGPPPGAASPSAFAETKISPREPCRTGRARSVVWLVLWLVGPVWAGIDWLRFHPYELSYYNFGLARAIDGGFEATYWYDAVTPRVLRDLNERLPPNVTIGFPDPLINPETFDALQSLGRLRSDINAEAESFRGLPWMWLLTHSSKATAFTRLLYACEPWYASGPFGVRLFSVADPPAVRLAWALHTLTVVKDESRKLGPLLLNEPIFQADAATIRQALAVVQGQASLATAVDARLGQLVRAFRSSPGFRENLQRVLDEEPAALDQAIEIVTRRSEDVRTVLAHAGYLRPERFHGYFRVARN